MATYVQEQAEKVGAGEGSRWRDGLGVGIAGVAAGALAIMAVMGEVFVDALVLVAVLSLLVALAARRDSTALRWVIAGLMTAFVGINAVYAMADLSHPESPGPFIATAVVVVFGATTVVLAVLSARRRAVATRRVWLGVGALLAVAAIGSLAAAATVEDDVAQPGEITVVAQDAGYPDEVLVAPGAEGLLVANRDPYRHNFVIDGEISAVELPADTDVRIAIDDLGPGTYRFHCSVTGHEGMEGQLVVE